jgi:glycosyltransferase involved in cell wall biosynthesis
LNQDTTICFVFFKGLNLTHLDAALYSLSKQDMSRVNDIHFLNNDTEFTPEQVEEVAHRYFNSEQIGFSHIYHHGDPNKTHSWSVNTVVKIAQGPFIFFTRADYILAFDCLERLRAQADSMLDIALKPFVSGWCWQMAYDREARNIEANVDLEQYNWRELGMPGLLNHPYAFRFHETDQDAGVWLTSKEYIQQVGGMNEKMSSWGYQQSTFQRVLRNHLNVTCFAIPDYLFAHQHHYVPRDFEKAQREYNEFGGGV